MAKRVLTLGLLLVVALVFTACGKKDGAAAPQNTTGGSTKEITVHAKNFEFDQKEIRVNKGDTVKITLVNAQGNHSLKIDGYNKEIQGGKTVTFTADKTGEFKFACNIVCGQGHADMTGKLIVQ